MSLSFPRLFFEEFQGRRISAVFSRSRPKSVKGLACALPCVVDWTNFSIIEWWRGRKLLENCYTLVWSLLYRYGSTEEELGGMMLFRVGRVTRLLIYKKLVETVKLWGW
jgi:hypothetical protein